MRSLHARLKNFAALFVLGAGAALMVMPFLDLVSGSLKTARELAQFPPVLWPEEAQWGNYRELFATLPLPRLLLNSFIMAVGGTALTVATSAAAGYALARLRFPGRGAAFRLVLGAMFFPQFVFLIPVFYLLGRWPLAGGNDLLGQGGAGLLQSHWALVLPFAVSGFGIFLVRQFARQLPAELIEAARLDGAGELVVFRRVALPLLRPALATVAIFSFIALWNEYVWTLTVSTGAPRLMTLPVGIEMLRTEFIPFKMHVLIRAALVVSVVPVLGLFLGLQKYYFRGVLGRS